MGEASWGGRGWGGADVDMGGAKVAAVGADEIGRGGFGGQAAAMVLTPILGHSWNSSSYLLPIASYVSGGGGTLPWNGVNIVSCYAE